MNIHVTWSDGMHEYRDVEVAPDSVLLLSRFRRDPPQVCLRTGELVDGTPMYHADSSYSPARTGLGRLLSLGTEFIGYTQLALCMSLCLGVWVGCAPHFADEVASVGSCDSYGYCSVRLTSGRVGATYYPVPHQLLVCIRAEEIDRCGAGQTQTASGTGSGVRREAK